MQVYSQSYINNKPRLRFQFEGCQSCWTWNATLVLYYNFEALDTEKAEIKARSKFEFSRIKDQSMHKFELNLKSIAEATSYFGDSIEEEEFITVSKTGMSKNVRTELNNDDILVAIDFSVSPTFSRFE